MDNLDSMTDSELEDLLAHEERQESLMNNGQMVRKIALNSYYGALANIHFCLFDLRLAESITKSGQLAIRWAGQWVNVELNKLLNTDGMDYIIYTDTDSIYVSMESVARRLGERHNIDIDDESNRAWTVNALDKFSVSYMEPMIAKGYDEMAKHTNAYQQLMIMDREVISDNGVFCTKKRYALSVWNSEGVAFEEAYIKTMGLDVVKSSTPEVVRGAMKKTIMMILNHNEGDVQKYIRDFKKTFNSFKPEEIAFPRGVNGMEEKYCAPDGSFLSGKTVPINSRACITYNNTLRSLSLNEYKEVIPGDKIKYIHVREPNKLQTNVIGFSDVLPPEFNLHNKIDYDLMFEKVYLKPMRDILELIGWSDKPVATLESFFS